MSKVTIYMPVFNCENYISQAIDSVIAQTYTSWELLVIDDASTDSSVIEVERYLIHKNISLIKNTKNHGLNHNNNLALRLASGEYIVRLDPDDYLDESFLSSCISLLEAKNDVHMVYPDFYLVDENDRMLGLYRKGDISGSENDLLDLPAHGACTVFRTSILRTIGPYNERVNCQDGYDIWIKYVSRYRPYNLNVPLFYYRQSPTSLSSNTDRLFQARRSIMSDFASKGLPKANVNTLIFVPIFGGSNSSKSWPFASLNGRPLMTYVLDTAVAFSSETSVIVSTDDEKVAEYVASLYPNVLLDIRDTTNKYFENYLEVMKASLARNFHNLSNYDFICRLSITNPMITESHIRQAIDSLNIFSSSSVLAVIQEDAPYYKHDGTGLKPINDDGTTLVKYERDLIYKECGGLSLLRAENLQSDRPLGEKIGHIVLSKHEGLKINSEYDLWLAEKVFSEHKNWH